MKKILLDRVISSCFDCPMYRDTDDENIMECSFSRRRALKSYLVDGNIPVDCQLPDKPIGKRLSIKMCSQCYHCKPSDLETVITTYPPIYEREFICGISNKSFKNDKVIQDFCRLEDDE